MEIVEKKLNYYIYKILWAFWIDKEIWLVKQWKSP